MNTSWRLLAIKFEASTVLIAGWFAQATPGLAPAWLEKGGALTLAGIAIWRLLWYELPGWRLEFRLERESNAAAHAKRDDALLDLAASVRELTDAERNERLGLVDQIVSRIRDELAKQTEEKR